MGQIRGPNLFHSFGHFNLSQGESATFTGPNTITNILSRVTGGQPSTIDGTIRSQIPGAHLYLLNPSGVMFGPNASLDVSGSFHVSTADHLRLAEGARFFARLGETSTLSVAPPVAFGFMGTPPAAMIISGSTLQVPAGQSLSVGGGDIRIVGGNLTAPSGHIRIASRAAGGEVLLNPAGQEETGRLSSERPAMLELSDRARLDVSGNGGGTVSIQGDQLVMNNARISADTLGSADGARLGIDLRLTGDAVLSNNATITTATSGAGRGGDIVVQARHFTLAGSGQINAETLSSGILSSTSGTGAGGAVTITATTLDIQAGSNIRSLARGNGDAGGITVEAERVTVGRNSSLSSEAGGNPNNPNPPRGAAGPVTVRATEAISITGRLLSNSSSLGRAGVLSVTAPTLTLADGGQIQLGTAGGGPGQDLVIEVGRLTLTGGARIVSITTGTQGATIIVRATEAISIAGRDQREGTFSNLPSGLFTVTLSSGAGGRVTVTAPTLTLGDGARISAVNANGPGGAISVEVGRLTLTGGARIDSSASTSINSSGGQGGTVMVTATEAVSIAGRDQGAVSINGQTQRGLPSGLFSDTSGGGGAGGRVSVTTPTLTLADGAEISAKTASRGAGGTVTVAAGRVMVTGTAQITTEATGTGPGGTVVVEAKDTVLLTQGGTISASSFGQGDAGQITITAGSLFRSRQGLVTAEARIANGGEIRLAAPLVALTDSVITTTVPGGRGGNITIGPGVTFLTLNDSQIRAQALREAGGNITLDTTLLATPISTVAASGTLTIGQLVLPESLISVLPSPAFAQALELSRNRCVTRLQEGQVSRFVIGGRDGVPLEPGSLLPSPLAWGEQPDPAPLTDVQVGGLERPNPGSLYLREAHAQARWPGVLDVECTKWMGQ